MHGLREHRWFDYIFRCVQDKKMNNSETETEFKGLNSPVNKKVATGNILVSTYNNKSIVNMPIVYQVLIKNKNF